MTTAVTRPSGIKAASNSEILLARMEITCGRLDSAYERLWRHPQIGRLVPAFLVLMHQIVRASLPLMQTAQVVAQNRSAADAVCRKLSKYLVHHIEEERNHDEWLLQDLETAHIGRDDVMGRVPPASVASLVGAQYYWVLHHDPVSLLGYMRILEGSPPSNAHIDNLQRKSGLPTSLFRTYALHGELDPHHLGDLDRFLDSLPLNESQGYLIWASASHTADALAMSIEKLVDCSDDE